MNTHPVMRPALRWGVTGLALCLVLSAGAAAPDDKKVARAQQERIQRMQQAQQALEQEKTQLSADKADVERKLQSTRSDLERARALARKDAARQVEIETLQKEKEGLLTQVATLGSDLAAARQKLQQADQSAVQQKQLLQSGQREFEVQNTALQSCERQNQGLYQLNTDLLARYEGAASQSKGLVGSLFNPFGQVRVENEGTAYRDQLDALKRVPATAQ